MAASLAGLAAAADGLEHLDGLDSPDILEGAVQARVAQLLLGNAAIVPDNFGFAPYATRSVAAAKAAFEALGIGYDEQGATPGAFYTFPGDPMANGTGMAVLNATAV